MLPDRDRTHPLDHSQRWLGHISEFKKYFLALLCFRVIFYICFSSWEHKGSPDLFGDFWHQKLPLFGNFWGQKISRAFITISGPRN